MVGATSTTPAIDKVQASLKKRYARERRFRYIGMGAVVLGMLIVSVLFISIVSKGYTAFQQTHIRLAVELDETVIDPDGTRDPRKIARADFQGLVKKAMREAFPYVSGRRDKRDLYKVVSSGASFQLADIVKRNPELIGTRQAFWLVADDDIDVYFKGKATKTDVQSTRGIASPTGATGDIKILSTANDFAEVLAGIKADLLALAGSKQRELGKQKNAFERIGYEIVALEQAVVEARSAGDSERIGILEADLSDKVAQRSSAQTLLEGLQIQIADLQKRAAALGGEERLTPDMPSYLIKINGGLVKATQVENSGVAGQVLVPLHSTADAAAGRWEVMVLETPEGSRRVKDQVIAWVWDLQQRGAIEKQFNSAFFSSGDSREPELAGIGGAAAGSLLTLLVTLLLSFPIGVAAAVYLEEFAPKNRWTDLIEVNINNLAAVPSIVFGLLGLAVFINFFGLPRSAPLVGGLVLTLMTLPTIIIASRAALKSVPPSIREAALGVGASKMQTIFHHVLPLAMPGMLTGTIIGMAQALGESAPLLMIGMVAFIVDIPGGLTDPATVLPVQIFLWADSPERAFVERTSAAIMVLLAFLIAMNAFAVIMRRRFERRW
jgi:phosphate transport system permease protein